MVTESQVALYRHRVSVPRHQGPNPKLRIRGHRSQRKIRLVSTGQAYTTVGPRAEGLDPKVGHRVQLKVVGEAEEEAPLDAVESGGPVGVAHGFKGMEKSAPNPDDLERRSSVSHRCMVKATSNPASTVGIDGHVRGAGSQPPSHHFQGQRHHLHFLNALCGVCGAHGRGGRATLPFPKEAVALKVKEIMMDSFFNIEPKFLLAMRAVGKLRNVFG
ncbi:UNVERIFIED_CONTAM: hypothetical protein K2H54_009753 [Gekko kuhli]